MTAQSNSIAILKSYADRLERLHAEVDGLKGDIKDLRSEVKSAGFNVKALDKLIAIRRKDGADAETAFLNDLLLYAGIVGVQLSLALPGESA